MLCLSQTAGYAIHALGLVANGGGRLCLIREIATLSGIPKPYLAKIVNQLSREGLVSAKRGYRGGIYLTRHPREITLLEIVEAIEGKEFIAECMLGLTDCSTPCLCPTHEIWQRVRDEIKAALGKSTLADVLAAMQGEPAQTEPPKSAGRRAVPSKWKKSSQTVKQRARLLPCKGPGCSCTEHRPA
ncbi:MAG TPA: Rrf2 family transcriptional regulator [Candidatus Sulfotelmatobacter sp.]|nr:Rrf2 family transcriptional regulator [Candidatus Sulfotelmatobacter sp.]